MSKCTTSDCSNFVPEGRVSLGYSVCKVCGQAASEKVKHTLVPLHKSNYVVVTDRNLLSGINNKGGLVK
jgi:hypothetical protein